MQAPFTAAHRGGEGEPLLLIHGFTDTWRTWELVLGSLERRHEVLAPTLAGHAGGPSPAASAFDTSALVDGLEAAMDDVGWDTAHIAGNSLGGHLALRLAERGRARSVTALAPGGGWAAADTFFSETLVPYFTQVRAQVTAAEPHIDELTASPEGRRMATAQVTCNYEHIPAELIAHQLRGVIGCTGADALLEHGRGNVWGLVAESIACPVRVVWGEQDKILPWPRCAERLRGESLPQADWVVLEDVGHCPQLDVPLPTAELIGGWTGT